MKGCGGREEEKGVQCDKVTPMGSRGAEEMQILMPTTGLEGWREAPASFARQDKVRDRMQDSGLWCQEGLKGALLTSDKRGPA